MSVLGNPRVAAVVARTMQALAGFALERTSRRGGVRYPEYPGDTREITIPTDIAPARAVVYRPPAPRPDSGSGPDLAANPPVHVNFHGGGYVMRGVRLDDALCRYLAAEAGVVVINLDYVVAPQHPFPEPPHQCYQAVRWVAEHGAEHGWDGTRLTVGGQSAGGGLAAAVARQALERGGPPIALQVLHYPPLDLVTPPREKRSVIARPMLRPWMGEVFDNAYVPDPARRADPLVSPAGPDEKADLTGIAPALVITAEYDRLRAEGERYARRLEAVGALVHHHEVAKADHGYDMADTPATRESYALIARLVKEATRPAAPAAD